MISRQIYLIIVILSVLIFMYFFSLFLDSFSQYKKTVYDLKQSREELKKILNDPKCLGLENNNLLVSHDKVYYFSRLPIIDYKKIELFSSEYKDMIPYNCSFLNGGYKAVIKVFPLSFESTNEDVAGSSIWEKIFPIINGKNVTFVVDFSGSMANRDAGTCDSRKYGGFDNSRTCCLGKFLIEFVKNFDEGTNISIIQFGYCGSGPGCCGCCAEIVIPKTTITNENRSLIISKIKNSLIAYGGTPLRAGLRLAVNNVNSWNTNYIVLLTDGHENACTDLSIYSPVPVYSIGLSSGAGMSILEEISKNSNGTSFKAKTCKELVSMKTYEKISVDIEKKEYSIGRKYLSSDFGGVSFSFSYPVLVYYNNTLILPGEIVIEYSNDWLETLINAIEKSCMINESTNAEVRIPYNTTVYFDSFLNKNLVCVNYMRTEYCQPLDCNLKIDRTTLLPGKYLLSVKTVDGHVKIL